MHQAIIFVSCLLLLTLTCSSARGIVLSLFVCVCVCVCPPVFSVAARALSVKRGHVGK